jgi:hypothetical protein
MQVMPPSRAVIFALAMALGASAHIAAQARSRGHVAGHTTDTEGSPLPGVTVTVMGVSIRRHTVTDLNGRFDVAGVPPGVYEMSAELPGFERQSQRIVLTTSDSTLNISFALKVADLCEVQYVDLGFSDAVVRADAIFHVRVGAVESTMPARKGCSARATPYTASVIDGIKVRSQTAQPLAIKWVQDSRPTEEIVGEDYLIFLTWDTSLSRYDAANGQYAIPIHDGRVEWHRDDVPNVGDGDPLDRVTSVIRAVLASCSKTSRPQLGCY